MNLRVNAAATMSNFPESSSADARDRYQPTINHNLLDEKKMSGSAREAVSTNMPKSSGFRSTRGSNNIKG